MRAITMVARALWRRQGPAILVLAVLGGIGLGGAITAMASARRSDSAYARLREATRAPDAFADGSDLADSQVAAITALPEVRGAARFSYTPVAPGRLVPGRDAGGFVGLDRGFLAQVYRPWVRAGRLARPDAPDEIVVNEALARAADLRVGQRVRLTSGFEDPRPIGHATVVGIVRGIFDVGANSTNPASYLSRAFLDAHPALAVGPEPGLLVRTRNGASDLARLSRDLEAATGGTRLRFDGAAEATTVQRTLRVQTYGYALLALVLVLATGVAVVQALSRILSGAFVDLATLHALGFTPRQRHGLGAVLVAPVVVLGPLVATAVGVAASPLIPTGVARRIDPSRGIQVDGLVTLVLVATWVGVVGVVGVALAWRERPGRDERVRRPVRWTSALPLRARFGVDAALTRPATASGVAARSALVAVAVGVAGVVAVLVFGTSLGRLLDQPRLEGWSFDAAVVSTDPLATLRAAAPDLTAEAAVDRVTWGSVVNPEIGGLAIESYALAPGGITPTIRAGRRVRADDEMVLGADTLRLLGRHIGDVVTVRGPEGHARFHVVGSSTYPEIGNNGDLASAATLTRRAAAGLGLEEVGSFALVELRPGSTIDALDRYGAIAEVVAPFDPPRVHNLREVGAIPWLLAVGLALIALAGLAHGMVRSVRLRRHDFAVLAVLGAKRRDERAMVGWQAVTCATTGALVGAVIGIAGGRVAWAAVASSTGVVEEHVIPWAGIVGVVLATVLAALAVALGVIVAGRHARPADGLRTE